MVGSEQIVENKSVLTIVIIYKRNFCYSGNTNTCLLSSYTDGRTNSSGSVVNSL